MERMPPELHLQACECPSLADLKNCRLVNKQLEAIGAMKLYRQLVFHARYASVDRIHAVAAHPLIRSSASMSSHSFGTRMRDPWPRVSPL